MSGLSSVSKQSIKQLPGQGDFQFEDLFKDHVEDHSNYDSVKIEAVPEALPVPEVGVGVGVGVSPQKGDRKNEIQENADKIEHIAREQETVIVGDDINLGLDNEACKLRLFQSCLLQ